MTTQPMYFHAGLSSNRKTGPMLVTTSSENTCPPSCKQREICYAKYGFIGMHWRKVSSGKVVKRFHDILDMVRQLPNGRLWRWNQAGDLPGIGEHIDESKLDQLVRANLGKKGFTYTHKYKYKKNVELIRKANKDGFTINISADSIDEAIEFFHDGLPTVVTVSAEEQVKDTIDTVKFITCPAETHNVQCVDCKLCAMPRRSSVIVFHVHGTRKNKWGK